MTNRKSIFGALLWVVLACALTGSALQPASAATRGCIKSLTNGSGSCAIVA